MYSISAIKREQLGLVWGKVAVMLARGIEHSNGELTYESVKEKCEEGALLLLTIEKENVIIAACTVEQRTFETGKKVLYLTVGGGAETEGWMQEMHPVLDQLAQVHGCDEIYVIGRPGWERKLKQFGYSKIHTILSRKVGG